jgi:hypothetical protein
MAVISGAAADDDRPAAAGRFAGPLLAAVGAAFTLAGTFAVHRHPLAGHGAIAVGLGSFLVGTRGQPIAASPTPAPDAVRSSRAPLGGLVVLAFTAVACAAGLSDGFVFAGWVAGCTLLIAGLVTSRLLASSFAWPPTRAAIALSFVVALAAAVNWYRLSEFPRAVHGDVGEIALLALTMDVPREIFRTSSWWGMPGMHNAFQRLGFVFVDGLTGARATDATLGVVAMIPLFATIRPIAGLEAAVVAAVLGIGSANMINTWRSGLALGPPILLTALALWSFLRAMSTAHSPRDFFLLAGAIAGLSLQVYVPARIIPPLLACFALHELLFGPPAGKRRMLRGFGWTVVAAVLVAAPLLWHYVESPIVLQPRSEKFVLNPATLSTLKAAYGTESVVGVLWSQTLRSFGMFHYFPNGEDVGFFVGESGFFEPLTAALFLLGAAMSSSRLPDRRFGWPLGTCVSGLLLLTVTIYPPSYHRAGPAAIAALVVVGIGAGALLRSLEQLASSVFPGREWIVTGCVAFALAAAGFVVGLRTYFFDYCEREWKLTDSTEIARRIAAEPVRGTFVYLMTTPLFDRGYGNIRFMARNHAAEDLQPGDPPPAAADLHPGANLFIALPHRVPELRALARALPPGRWEKHYKRSPPDELEFLLLTIRKPSRDDGP